MITENPFESNKQKNSNLVSYYEPKISKRFYAFFIDNICIYQPISYFLSAPIVAFIKKNTFYDLGHSTGLYIQLLVIFYFFISTLFSTFFTYIYSASPGQKLFGLKVISSNSQSKLALWNCFVRSFSFYIQIFIFFLPSLNLASSTFGLHGKISDTTLKSISPSFFKPLIDSTVLRAFYVSVFILFLFSFGNALVGTFDDSLNSKVVENSCKDIKSLNLHKAVKKWSDNLAPSLIYVLYKNKHISKACFRDYINEYISVNDSDKEGMYYLWLSESSSIIKNKYEKSICKTKNSYCDLINGNLEIRVTKNFSEMSDIEMSYLIKNINFNEDTLNWDAIIKYNSLTSVLNWLPDLRDKLYYLLSKEIKPTKYSTYISKEYIETKTSEKIYEIAAVDACYSELLKSCNFESKYCEDFIDSVNQKFELSFYDQINLSYISYCDKNFKPQLRGWDNEKYLNVFLDVIKNSDNFSDLNTIVAATYSHPRLKMASLSILLNEGVSIDKLNQHISNLNMKPQSLNSSRLPASLKPPPRGEK